MLDNLLELIFGGKSDLMMSETLKGETVDSKAEKLIANYFFNNEISYQYKKPLRLGLFSSKRNSPDFYLSSYDIYVKYWKDSGDNRMDNQIASLKKKYDKKGIKIIHIYPMDLHKFDKIFRERFEELNGKKLITRKEEREEKENSENTSETKTA